MRLRCILMKHSLLFIQCLVLCIILNKNSIYWKIFLRFKMRVYDEIKKVVLMKITVNYFPKLKLWLAAFELEPENPEPPAKENRLFFRNFTTKRDKEQELAYRWNFDLLRLHSIHLHLPQVPPRWMIGLYTRISHCI